eukprot:4051177-Pleurochrysis_carterae.AAC.1
MPAVLTLPNPTFKKVPVFTLNYLQLCCLMHLEELIAVARFKIAGVAFWYKPNSSNMHIYPALKNADDLPVSIT